MTTDEVSVLVYSLMLIVLFAGVVESQGQAPPSTGLYFTLNGAVYLPGDTILITDIGSNTTTNRSDPQSSLVCVTTNVNTQCCSKADNPNGGGRGEWYLPDRTRILNTQNLNFYRTRYTQQVRLYRNKGFLSPTGVFTCEVPNDADSTMPFTTTITIATPLNVALTESGDTPMAGQNYTLTCEASGGEPMPLYTYMWLRNGSIVSGQTSSTYSFSPLLVVHSGQYSCRVSVGTMNVTSRSVNITVVATATQLYFNLKGNRYEPGDSVLITDIRLHDSDRGPGDSLVCVTADVNTQCCTDRGGVGEWFFPDGSMVLRNIDDPNQNTQIIRTGRTNQVRLNFRTRQTSPTGEYTCVVPETGGSVIQTAGINLVEELPVTTNPSTSPTTIKTTMVTTQQTAPPPPPPQTIPTTTTPLQTTPPQTTPPQTTPPQTTPPQTTPPQTTPPQTTPPQTTPLQTTPPLQTTMTAPTTTTKMTPLTVMVVSNGSVLSAGQNHTLTCEASGGGSMDYTYTWLKDGSVVSGQTSPTYSFSPLLMVDSGQYSCRMRVGSMTVTSWNVTITVGPSTGLYFTLSGTVYLPGDTILIADIGSENNEDQSDPGSSLVCVSTNVNAHCCRSADNPNGGSRGEWLDPNRTRILNTPDTNFYRTRYTQQVRLNRRNSATLPTGVFTCEIPNEVDSIMPHTATITITSSISSTTTAMTTTTATATTTAFPPLSVKIINSGGTLRAGQNHTLTCVASGGESMAYTYVWLKKDGVVSGQTSSTYSFTSLEVADSGRYSCQVRVGSMTVTSESVDITVLGTLYFTWRGNRYEPGDSILITEIRLHDLDRGPADSLVCVTTDVNTQCCTDRGGVGEWFFPNGSMVLRNIDDTNGNTQIIRTGRANQVRLNFRTRQTSPTGEYTCVVPEANSSVIREGIRLVTVLPQLNVTLTGSGGIPTEGQDYMLTCTASGGGSMAYTYKWLRNGSVVPGQNSFTYSFIPLRATDFGKYSCQVIVQSITVTSEGVDITVVDAVPNSPSNLTATMHNATSITITWTETTTTNIDRYEVTYSYTVRRCSAPTGPAMTNTVTSTSRSHTLMNLNEDSTYTITVRNINGQLSNMATITANTATAVPSASPSSVKSTTVGTTSITIEWSELDCADRNGDITGYRVRYGPTYTPSQRQSANISGKMFTVDRKFITLSYDFEVAAVNVDGTGPYSTSLTVHSSGEKDGGGSNIAAVVVSVTVLFLVVAIITAILIFTWYKRWRQDKYSQQDIPLKEMGLEQVENSDEIKEGEPDEKDTVFIDQEWLKPVFVDVFPERVQQMHADRDKMFELEYNAIEKSPQASYNTAVILENRVRNRFGNIFPYDFNRVILESKPGELNSDYINASYIDGYQRRKMYIAAQGPTENSLEDFWRMIWEQRVPTIVMLTKVYEERKKCEQYWPENADTPFVPVPGSPLFIKYNFVLPFPEFTIREMTVTNSDEPGTPPLTVTLYHYLGWPDHGVPANAISMVNFVKRVRKSHPYSEEDLLLVHCSAGVGRTGTFITLDAMLERISVKKSINIFEFVTDLRKQRVLMVQTLVQYVFIHDALEELLTCGETEIAAGDIRIVIGKLIAPVGPQDTIGFSKQFKILEKVSNKGKNVDCSDATIDPNIPKNRYEKILPYNYTRVHLRPSAAHGSDYINASFIEGYRQKGIYIATQGPLPHTVNDFWRMIWEQEVRCIVMLCKTEENGEEVCHQYWPLRNGCCETFGKYIVTLTSEEEEEDYIIRKIDILEKQSKTSISQSGFTVTQIQYEKWPEDNVPETTMTVLEIANFVQKVQMGSGNKPIVVMCNNGIGRSGAFICMHSQMERMKAEAMVNFFQFIKAVRIQRAGLVTSEEQYEFCHHVLADFLDGFDTYANFKEII